MPYSTLYDRIHKTEGKGGGRGRKSIVLLAKEEKRISDHVQLRAELRWGMTKAQLATLIQQFLKNAKRGNPQRRTGLEHCNQLPSRGYIKRFFLPEHFSNLILNCRFCARNKLVLRKTMEITKGRFKLQKEDLVQWQRYTEENLVVKYPEMFQDPRRIFNQVNRLFY